MLTQARSAIHRLQPVFAPRSIAIIGATQDRRRIGGIALDHLVHFGFEGGVYPVNPKYTEIAGRPCFADIESVPEVPDLAVLAIATASVLPMLERCHARGVRAAVVYASGFAEESDEGAQLQQRVVAFARRSGMLVSGPNCMGHANLDTRAITAFATLFSDYPPAPAGSEPGETGLITQSGNMCAVLYALGRDRGVRFNHFINTGNEACIEFAEYLDYLADDAFTRSAIGYVEGLRDGARFIDVADRLRRADKALALLKVGDSEKGQQAALSHTAALAGNQAIYRAAFRQLGVMLAEDPAHLVDLAYLSAFGHRSAGRRVAVASVSGAMGALLTDLLVKAGLDVPTLPQALQRSLKARVPTIGMLSNPIDLTAQIFNREGVATQVMTALAGTDSVDTVLVYATGFMLDRIADELIAVARDSGRLFIAIDTGHSRRRDDLSAAGVAVFTDVGRCTRALATYLQWRGSAQRCADWQALRQTQPQGQAARTVAPLAAGALDEHDSKQWLAGFGVPVAQGGVAQSAAEAVQWQADLGAPVVLKVLSADIAHKTDVGGVRLNLEGSAAVHEAFDAVMQSARSARPDAALRGVLLEPMASGACELIVGVTRDPVFGLALTVGLGGVLTEVLHDVSHRLLPVDAAMAREMLGELKAWPLLQGVRGKPAADVDAACRAIAALSSAALAAGDSLQELEVNPLLVRATGQGAIALDALVIGTARD